MGPILKNRDGKLIICVCIWMNAPQYQHPNLCQVLTTRASVCAIPQPGLHFSFFCWLPWPVLRILCFYKYNKLFGLQHSQCLLSSTPQIYQWLLWQPKVLNNCFSMLVEQQHFPFIRYAGRQWCFGVKIIQLVYTLVRADVNEPITQQWNQRTRSNVRCVNEMKSTYRASGSLSVSTDSARIVQALHIK